MTDSGNLFEDVSAVLAAAGFDLGSAESGLFVETVGEEALRVAWRPADMLFRATSVAGTDQFFWLHTVLYRALAVLLQQAGFQVEIEDIQVMLISRPAACG